MSVSVDFWLLSTAGSPSSVSVASVASVAGPSLTVRYQLLKLKQEISELRTSEELGYRQLWVWNRRGRSGITTVPVLTPEHQIEENGDAVDSAMAAYAARIMYHWWKLTSSTYASQLSTNMIGNCLWDILNSVSILAGLLVASDFLGFDGGKYALNEHPRHKDGIVGFIRVHWNFGVGPIGSIMIYPRPPILSPSFRGLIWVDAAGWVWMTFFDLFDALVNNCK